MKLPDGCTKFLEVSTVFPYESNPVIMLETIDQGRISGARLPVKDAEEVVEKLKLAIAAAKCGVVTEAREDDSLGMSIEECEAVWKKEHERAKAAEAKSAALYQAIEMYLNWEKHNDLKTDDWQKQSDIVRAAMRENAGDVFLAKYEEREQDAEIGAFLCDEIKKLCEAAGVDMSQTPPMMYPEAIMAAWKKKTADLHQMLTDVRAGREQDRINAKLNSDSHEGGEWYGGAGVPERSE